MKGLSYRSLNERRLILIFGIERNGTKSHFIIGITGCYAGAGATHLAIALANLCGSKYKAATAYLEFHKRDEIRLLMTDATLPYAQKENRCRTYFRIHDVDYYPATGRDEFPALLNLGYRYLVLDFGSLSEADLTEFLRCDKKIIIGSVAPWKMDNFRNCQKLLNQKISSGEGCIYLMRTGKPHTFHSISGRSPIVLRKVPLIQNPFRIEKELFPVLQELLD